MGRHAPAGACLATLLRMAMPFCQQAEQECPRTGPGRRPQHADWLLAALIMVAVAKRRKSKSAQYRFLLQRQAELLTVLNVHRLPSRTTYFARYGQAERLFRVAIRLQGARLVAEKRVDARLVAVDKSVLSARGPVWSKKARAEGRRPRNVDGEASWTYSAHHGWVYGYSYEVVVSAGKNGVVAPLLASVAGAHAPEAVTFREKIGELPARCQYVLADKGYDSNRLGELVEWNAQQRRTGRRYLCPQIYRRGRRPRRQRVERGSRRFHRQLRDQRRAFFMTQRARQLYRRRGATVEPFNQWFKSLFELSRHVWHRGLQNNRTQLLAALFVYQLLIRYNHRCGQPNGKLQWLLDGL